MPNVSNGLVFANHIFLQMKYNSIPETGIDCYCCNVCCDLCAMITVMATGNSRRAEFFEFQMACPWPMTNTNLLEWKTAKQTNRELLLNLEAQMHTRIQSFSTMELLWWKSVNESGVSVSLMNILPFNASVLWKVWWNNNFYIIW